MFSQYTSSGTGNDTFLLVFVHNESPVFFRYHIDCLNFHSEWLELLKHSCPSCHGLLVTAVHGLVLSSRVVELLRLSRVKCGVGSAWLVRVTKVYVQLYCSIDQAIILPYYDEVFELDLVTYFFVTQKFPWRNLKQASSNIDHKYTRIFFQHRTCWSGFGWWIQTRISGMLSFKHRV